MKSRKFPTILPSCFWLNSLMRFIMTAATCLRSRMSWICRNLAMEEEPPYSELRKLLGASASWPSGYEARHCPSQKWTWWSQKKSQIYPRQIQKDVEQLSLKTVLCFREMSMWIHCRVSEPPSFIDMAVAFCKWSDPSILSLKLEHTTAGIVLADWWWQVALQQKLEFRMILRCARIMTGPCLNKNHWCCLRRLQKGSFQHRLGVGVAMSWGKMWVFSLGGSFQYLSCYPLHIGIVWNCVQFDSLYLYRLLFQMVGSTTCS